MRVIVSIHTPVWGVTAKDVKLAKNAFVSIHTPVWGVTQQLKAKNQTLWSFNPHARVGRDLAVPNLHEFVEGVSIHTPVWGVTLKAKH